MKQALIKLTRVAFLILIFFVQSTEAFELGLIGGIQSNELDRRNSSISVNGDTGFHFGLIGFAEISRSFSIRSGAIIVQRKFQLISISEKQKIDIRYLEVPLSLVLAFNDSFGLFAGPQFGLKISENCNSSISEACSVFDVKSLIYGASMGAQIQFTPNIGLEISYLLGASKVTESVENLSGLMVSGRLLY